MDVILFALQILFMAPMALRVLRPKTPGASIDHELAATFRTPGLFVHIVGLLLVWIGFDITFMNGGIDRAVTWQGVSAAVVLAAANVLMFWGFAALRSWRLLPAIEGGHELCMTGPYRLVRHPIYRAFDLLGVGIAIASPTAMVIAGAILLIAGGEMRSRAEERALVAAFGRRYEDYMRQVARRIPGVH